MIFRKIAAIIPLLFITNPSASQSFSTLLGSRAHGLAYASACLEDEWAMFNNVAGLSKAETIAIAVASHIRPQLPGANRIGATVCIPNKIGVAAVGAIRSGDNLYNEEIISAGFSNQLGIASLGIKVNYVQYNVEGFGQKGVATVSLGGIASLTKKIKIGAHIVNANQPHISIQDDERIPTTLITGANFIVSDQLLMAVELEKNLDNKATWKTGIEYQPLKKFTVRSGFNLYPNAIFFGTGLSTKKLKINYAFDHNTITGISHEASVGYHFAK